MFVSIPSRYRSVVVPSFHPNFTLIPSTFHFPPSTFHFPPSAFHLSSFIFTYNTHNITSSFLILSAIIKTVASAWGSGREGVLLAPVSKWAYIRINHSSRLKYYSLWLKISKKFQKNAPNSCRFKKKVVSLPRILITIPCRNGIYPLRNSLI